MGNTDENIKAALAYYDQVQSQDNRKSGCLAFMLVLGLLVAVILAVAILVGAS